MNATSREITITAVEGNHQSLDGGAMFGNVPRALWQRWLPPDDRGRVRLSCRAMLIETGDLKILCETGVGRFFSPALAERYGVDEEEHMLMKNLSALGVEQEKVDYVILSHLHFDHAGGLLPSYEQIQAGQNQLLFPNAKYVVGTEALERCQKPHFRDRASYIPGFYDLLQSSGRLVVIDGSHIPGVLEEHLSFRYSSGHTPGQMHVCIAGQKDTIVFAGDLVPGCAWVHLPVTMGYDRYAELVIDEKEELYTDMLAEKWKFFFTHDPKVSLASLSKDDKGRFSPTDCIESPVRLVI